MRSLSWDLEALAVDTWERIERGDRRGLRLREDTITEVNLLELDRRHPQLNVHRFNQNVEKSVGADWEWFIGTGNRWLCLRVQAKRMDGDEYRQLQHGGDDGDDYQYDTLLRVARAGVKLPGSGKRTVPTFPYYVFFNGWTAWPTGVPWHGCPRGAQHPNCMHAAVESFGCATMPAALVKAIHAGRGAAGRKVAEYLPYSIPWSWLFGMPTVSAAPLTARGVLHAVHIRPSGLGPNEALPWQLQSNTRSVGTGDWALSPQAPRGASLIDIYRWHRAIASVTESFAGQNSEEPDGLQIMLTEYWNTVRRTYEDLTPTTEGLGPLPAYAEAVRRLTDDRFDDDLADDMQPTILRFAAELEGPLDVIVTDLGGATS